MPSYSYFLYFLESESNANLCVAGNKENEAAVGLCRFSVFKGSKFFICDANKEITSYFDPNLGKNYLLYCIRFSSDNRLHLGKRMALQFR